MLALGANAPDFTLPDPASADGRTYTLSEALKTGPQVLFFYPADFSPVCTKQVCMFRDRFAGLQEAGIGVVGVSPQNASSKAKFGAKHNVKYVLLADQGNTVTKAYGASGFFGIPIPFVTRRMTYLVGRDGTIKDRLHNEVSVSAHEAFVERAIAAARAGTL
jgi:peroxiredoxin Q/BCP